VSCDTVLWVWVASSLTSVQGPNKHVSQNHSLLLPIYLESPRNVAAFQHSEPAFPVHRAEPLYQLLPNMSEPSTANLAWKLERSPSEFSTDERQSILEETATPPVTEQASQSVDPKRMCNDYCSGPLYAYVFFLCYFH
jgi:hypothetical protein